MGMGACIAAPSAPPAESKRAKGAKEGSVEGAKLPPRGWRGRHRCDAFYWDISSVFLKTVCLATFFVAEAPRRAVALATRAREPEPRFTCAAWGYRMCACGHHYYDHGNTIAKEDPFASPPAVAPTTETPDAETAAASPTLADGVMTAITGETPKPKRKRKRKRRWYWPF